MLVLNFAHQVIETLSKINLYIMVFSLIVLCEKISVLL